MGQNSNRQPTLQELAESKKRRRKIPPSFKFFMYLGLGWCYLGALLYATGIFNFKADVVDSFMRWSVGFSGLLGIGMVLIAIWILEQD
jgi:hypothetical protein